MKYIFVINGREDKLPSIREELSRQLPGIDIEYDVYETQGIGDGIRYVRIYCDLHPDEEVFFIACGGSGTFNEVASGVVGFKNKRVGFFALGQTNDLTKYYPDRDFRSLEKLLAGTPVNIDIVRANNWYSINMINIGFDAYVSLEGNRYMDAGMGFKKAYALSLIKGLLTRRRNKIQVIADGVKLNKKTMVLCSVANAQWCGGMFHFAPNASVDDGLMDVCLIKPCSVIAFAFILKHYIKGDQFESKFCLRHMVYCHAKHVELKSKNILFISPDGEGCADIDFSIDILPGEISFVLPRI
ncbi:MAG: hypothetical protein MJY89_04465 [Bacteroidales bacterium]|nr:hypothetical protein [Bacteroidales bacterium]